MPAMSRLARLVTAISAAAAVTEAATVEQIYNFTSYVSIENSILRPNGHLLFTTLGSGSLYAIDPTASSATPEIVATMPGATALTGFAQIGPDKYAIAGGVRGSYQYANETIYTVDFSTFSSPNETVSIAATLSDAVMLNGAAALADTQTSGLILLADARVACVWRVNVTSGSHDEAFSGDYLAAPAGATVPIGVNGLKVSGGWAWLSNTATGTLGRIAVDESTGAATEGDDSFEAIAVVSNTTSWDDFALLPAAEGDGSVELLACRSPYSVVLVSEAGNITTVAGANASEPTVLGCSSVSVANDTAGSRTAYVTTKGNSASGLGGQILRITGF